MLLINFLKKASFIISANLSRFYLMLFLFFLSLPSFYSYAQNLDSLLTVARSTKNDSVKIRMYNKIAFGYIFNDTDKALKVIEEGKASAKAANFNFGLTELVNTHGIYMDVTGKSDSAAH